MNAIATRIQSVQANIDRACERSGRTPDTVTLVAVSKTHPPMSILEALNAGIQHFGENRVEEAQGKVAEVNALASTRPTWHLIGHLQSRKAKSVPPLFDMVQSVDSLKLAQKLSEYALAQHHCVPILLQMNVSGEASKEGFEAFGWQNDATIRNQLWQTITPIFGLAGVRVEGLMTLAPYYEEAEATRPVFQQLAHLRGALQQAFGVELPHLSMGMSNDYAVAVEEGATLVRVGRAIFGER